VTIINRYILSRFIRHTALALAAFVSIYILIEFFDKVDDFLEHNAAAELYLYYFASKTPLIVSQVLPLTVLMGVFLTLGGFTRSNELTAMRSGGIGLYSIVAPLLIAATILAGGNFVLNEYLAAPGINNANYILRTRVKGKAQPLTRRDNLWFRDDNDLYHIDLVVPEKKLLHKISVYRFNDTMQLQGRIDASNATWHNGIWQADTATVRRFSTTSGSLISEKVIPAFTLPLHKKAQDFTAAANAGNQELNFTQLRHLSRRLQKEGLDATRYLVDMHSRLAAPFACLVMAIVAIPFALQKNRNINLALGISISIGIGMAFFIIQSTLTAIGYSGILPPWMAAWSADLLFLMLGMFFVLSTRE